jgi:hypothetical protein
MCKTLPSLSCKIDKHPKHIHSVKYGLQYIGGSSQYLNCASLWEERIGFRVRLAQFKLSSTGFSALK